MSSRWRVLLCVLAILGCRSPQGPGAQCVYRSDCGAGMQCTNGQCREACREDVDCPSGACVRLGGVRSCVAAGSVFACARDGDCPTGALCRSDGLCHAACSSAAECGGECSGGACAAALRVPSQGGDAGAGEQCSCASRPHAFSRCESGGCSYRCEEGFADCDGVAENGCEAQVRGTDPARCGACDAVCPTVPHARATCSSGVCGVACDEGFHLCSGVCVPVSSVNACGPLCTACRPTPNASPRCDGAGCSFECAPGFADCNGLTSDGCEVDLSLPTSCGGCGRACGPEAPLCALTGGAYACAMGCGGATPTLCGGLCVDTDTNPQSCGACQYGCSAPANGAPRCVAGSCGFVCGPGFHPCGPACVSDGSVASCGAACAPCPAPPANATSTCDGAACGFRCNAGFHLCGGACVSSASALHCGASCAPCAAPPGGTATCDGALCGVACPPGFHACGGQCVSDSSADSCGSSCTPCPTRAPHATSVVCVGGECVAQCSDGYVDCNGLLSDGCELLSRAVCGP